jgi:hypothetical protein
MTTSEWDLERDGFRILPRAVDAEDGRKNVVRL